MGAIPAGGSSREIPPWGRRWPSFCSQRGGGRAQPNPGRAILAAAACPALSQGLQGLPGRPSEGWFPPACQNIADPCSSCSCLQGGTDGREVSPGPPAPVGKGLWETGRAGGSLQHPLVPLLAHPPSCGHDQTEPRGPRHGCPQGCLGSGHAKPEPCPPDGALRGPAACVAGTALQTTGIGDAMGKGERNRGVSRRWVGSEVGGWLPKGGALLGTPAPALSSAPPGTPPGLLRGARAGPPGGK